MNKAEALTQIECIVVGTKSLDIKQHRQIGKVLDEYAQQVSRELAVKFTNYYRENILLMKSDRELVKEIFKEWYPNHQNQQ